MYMFALDDQYYTSHQIKKKIVFLHVVQASPLL